MEANKTATRIYLITFQDGGWIKGELSSDIAKALDEANAEYGDVSQIFPLPDTDAAVMKFVRACNEFDARGTALRVMTAKAERLERINDDRVKALRAIVEETMGHPPTKPYSADSYSPSKFLDAARATLAKAGAT